MEKIIYALWANEGESRESFVARADALLYQSKSEGRNRVCCEPDDKDALSA